MKRICDLFTIMGKAQEQNVNGQVVNRHWFFHYSGHVNNMNIEFYPMGWKEKDAVVSKYEVDFDNDNSIQAGYWFIKSNLR